MKLCPATVAIPDCIIDDYDLPPLAGWLYVVIVRHVKREQNDAFPSVARLAKLANMSEDSVVRYTKLLEGKGLICVQRSKSGRADGGMRTNNRYQLVNVGIVSAESENNTADGGYGDEKPEGKPVSAHSGYVSADVEHNQLKDIDALPKAGNASVAPISEPTAPLATRPPNPWYDAIKAVWGFTESYNGEIAKMLQGRSTRKGFVEYNLARDCLTPDDLRAWARWYRTNELNSDPNLHMLEDRMKIQSSITAWLERRQRKAADDQRRANAEQQWRAMHPELYGEAAVHQ